MKQRTRDEIRNALFEAAFVVLGVVLALGANEWREQRAGKARAERALTSILEELATNREAVRASADYHGGLLRAIGAAEQTGTPPDLQAFHRGFVSIASLQRTAWESASATGAFEDMGFDRVLELSRVYAQQERYDVQGLGVAPIIYEELFRRGTDGMLANYLNLRTLIGSFIYRERQLLALYDEVLDDATKDAGPGEEEAEDR